LGVSRREHAIHVSESANKISLPSLEPVPDNDTVDMPFGRRHGNGGTGTPVSTPLEKIAVIEDVDLVCLRS
jgi:hypothetical protein